MPEIRDIGEIGHLIDDDIRLRRHHGGANRRRVEPIGDRRFRPHPFDDSGLRRGSRRADDGVTGCNQLRNELKADGASGTRNKNSHGVILIFVATARQVVGANEKSSVRMWRRKSVWRGTRIRPGR
jgi:hypothetical protein